MGKEDDAWRRFREREDEKEEDAPGLREKRLNPGGIVPAPVATPGTTSDLEKLLQQIEPLIEQVGNLYTLFFQGIEKRPPTEKRRLLDSLVQQLSATPKTQPGIQFRCQTIIQRHLTHRERWDKMLRDFEDGKLRR